MKTKRFLSVLTLTALLPLSAAADIWQDPETKVNYEYTVGQSEASVLKGTNSKAGSPDVTGDIAILSKFTVDSKEYTVTTIGEYAFKGLSRLTNVEIPLSVTKIGNSAFYVCTGLTNIIIPSSVTEFGSSAFSGCTGLTSAIISEGVTSISSSAFQNCTSLSSVTIPQGVTSIGSTAFFKCSSLTSITIPSSVTEFGSSAFSDCTSLISVTISEGVTSIGYRTFYGCISLTNIVIPSSVTNIGSNAFQGCTGLTSITFSEGVNSISSSAFEGCTGLTNLTIPSSMTSIGSNAFQGCTGLTNISVAEGNTKYDSRDNCNAIIETSKNEIVKGIATTVIPESVTSIGNGAFANCIGLMAITIPKGITKIGSSVFSGCTGLTNISVAKGNTKYDSRDNCNAIIETSKNELMVGIATTVIPESVNRVGSSAFYGCTSLTSITIPSNVTSIGNSAFRNCTGLTSITIPSSVTSISDDTFYGCIGLTNATISEGVSSIGNNAFYNCSGLTSLTIPSSMTSIGDNAFYRCTSLTRIVIPEGVARIGRSAFQNCSKIENISIPSSVTSLGSNAFSQTGWYNSLSNGPICKDGILLGYKGSFYPAGTFEVPYYCRMIADEALQNMTNITGLSIGDEVVIIGKDAFKNTGWYNNKPDGIIYGANNGFTKYYVLGYKGTKPTGDISLYRDTKVIANSAFEGCNNLTSILIGGTNKLMYIGNDAFKNCSQLRLVQLENPTICKDAFTGCNQLNTLVFSGKGVYDYWSGNYKIGTLDKEAFNDYSATLRVEEGMKAMYESKENWKNFTIVEGNCAFFDDWGNPQYIEFRDNKVKEICLSNWDVDKDGNISALEAALVSDLGTKFQGSEITTFDDFKHFIGIKIIKQQAFRNCQELESVVIPEGVKEIWGMAFYNCNSLKNISIPASLTLYNAVDMSYGTPPFAACPAIESITVAEDNPFYNSHDNCNAIIRTADNALLAGCKNTIIPEGTTTIKMQAFDNCKDLKNIAVPEGVVSIEAYAFNYCRNLESIHIPASISHLEMPFNYCEKLQSITVAEDNKDFDSRNNCNAIIGKSNNILYKGCVNTIMPEEVTNIDSYAFSGCKGLKTISINEGATWIGMDAFAGCTDLESVILPTSLKTINPEAFYGCTSLAAVTIPQNVVTIGQFAFADCNILSEVTSLIQEPSSVQGWTLYGDRTINRNTFKNISEDAVLYVPQGTKEKYETTPVWNEFKTIVELGEIPTGIDYAFVQDGQATVTERYALGGQRMSGQRRGLNLIRMSNGTVRKVLVR